MAALQIIENLYSKLGEDLSTLIPESVPFLAELMEGRKVLILTFIHN